MKKTKKYISGGIVAALLLISMPFQTVVWADLDNDNNAAEVPDTISNYKDTVEDNADVESNNPEYVASGECGDNATWALDSAGTM